MLRGATGIAATTIIITEPIEVKGKVRGAVECSATTRQ